MLASFLVYLKPHTVARISRHAGRSLHGLFMNLVAQANAELADRLHSPMPAKPFTVSTLLGRFERDGRNKLAVPDQIYGVRYTVLSDDVFAALSRILLDKYLYGQTVDIANPPF